MKGLLRVLSPFAPDQSGAVSVLYELGGLIVICDAGGCAGNVCGFDEPRWFAKKSAVFSAGLRDMDAILGRDQRLIDKLAQAARQIGGTFAAIVGTPVPAVIATDYAALRRMGEKQLGLPVLTIPADGTALYDEGEEAAFLQLFSRFAKDVLPVEPGRLGVLGATPLDLSCLDGEARLNAVLQQQGWKKICCYGMGCGLDAVRQASAARQNLVVSPAGLKAAAYLQKTFGTPYTVGCPILPEGLKQTLSTLHGKKVLIVHQQVLANEARQVIEDACPDASVTTATWFLKKQELARAGDVSLSQEGEFSDFVLQGDYDVVVGDPMLRRALRGYPGDYVDFVHFAVSGQLEKPW